MRLNYAFDIYLPTDSAEEPIILVKKSYPTAPSITHQHIASILNLKLAKLSKNENPVRILDFGCGEGKFISYLIKLLPISHPDICFEIFGLDVEAWKLLEKKGNHSLPSNILMSTGIAGFQLLQLMKNGPILIIF